MQNKKCAEQFNFYKEILLRRMNTTQYTMFTQLVKSRKKMQNKLVERRFYKIPTDHK